jgi:hypothetical protein
MRKVIIELSPTLFPKNIYDDLFKTTYSISMPELLRVDFERAVKLGLVEIIVKEVYTINDVILPPFVEIINVLKSEGNKYLCLVKASYPNEFKEILKKFALDIIWTTPLVLTEDKVVISCIGEEVDLKKFLDLIKYTGEIKRISFQKASYEDSDILSCLTDKQKEVFIEGNKLGISKSTVAEHLRKAESRIISHILVGYKLKEYFVALLLGDYDILNVLSGISENE